MKKSIALAILAVVATATVAKADPVGAEIKYQVWAAQHGDWVRLHPDRARLFAHHPELAERYRTEWFNWHPEHPVYTEWAEHHPGWVKEHHERAEYFNAHPEAADAAKAEWWSHKETNREYRHWENEHPIH